MLILKCIAAVCFLACPKCGGICKTNIGGAKVKAVKAIIYTLALGGLAYLIATLVKYFDSFYPFFKDFFLYIKAEDKIPSGITSSEIVLCTVSGVLLIVGLIVYLANMANRGLRPIGFLPFLYSSIAGCLTFGLYYGAMSFGGLSETDKLPVWMLVVMLVGAAAFLGQFIYLIVTRTWRAIPLCFFYLLLGFCAMILVLLSIRMLLYAIGLIIIAVVMLSCGHKKRIVDKDGTVYEEI